MAKGKHDKPMTPWDADLSQMKYKDLKRACIIRGMLFEEVVSADHHGLASFFSKHYFDSQDKTQLDAFDDWMDGKLEQAGYAANDPIRNPKARLGYIGEYDEEGEIKSIKKPRLKGKVDKNKKKREKLEGFTIYSGTKKAMTYENAKKGISIPDTISLVLESFPDANEKSISIWYKRCIKEMKG